MAVTLRGKLARLPEERRPKVEARAAELIAEEMTLCDLRRALDRTQVHLAERMGVKQETVSRLEKRSDMLLSTLRGYVEAMAHPEVVSAIEHGIDRALAAGVAPGVLATSPEDFHRWARRGARYLPMVVTGLIGNAMRAAVANCRSA